MSGSDDEQVVQLKDWWQRNGKPLVTGGLIALVVVFGWQGWQRYQGSQAQGASNLYQQLLETVLVPGGKPEQAKVDYLAGELDKNYAGTAYAQYGKLFQAKVNADAGRPDAAAGQLQAVIDKPADAALGEIARERLSQVLAAQGKAEDALKLLDGEADKAFVASREELRGDLLVKLGRADDAAAAYRKAKAALADDAAVGDLQLKLDDLAKGDA